MSRHAYLSSNKAAYEHESSQFNPSRPFSRIRDQFLKHGIRKAVFSVDKSVIEILSSSFERLHVVNPFSKILLNIQ